MWKTQLQKLPSETVWTIAWRWADSQKFVLKVRLIQNVLWLNTNCLWSFVICSEACFHEYPNLIFAMRCFSQHAVAEVELQSEAKSVVTIVYQVGIVARKHTFFHYSMGEAQPPPPPTHTHIQTHTHTHTHTHSYTYIDLWGTPLFSLFLPCKPHKFHGIKPSIVLYCSLYPV